jgi:aspartate kinase
MLVLKFGGTSVGSANNIKKVAHIVRSYNEPLFVVLSAVSGTTNTLIEIHNLLTLQKENEAKSLIDDLELKYHALLDELFASEYYQLKALTFVRKSFDKLRSLTVQNQNDILAQGEVISTNLFQLYLAEISITSSLISALSFMSIDKNGEPETTNIKEKLTKILEKTSDPIIITQGFICIDHEGKIDNLKRGGSDYSASLIGAAINADEIQIWTDIDGMHNNDPRFVEDTFSINEISFDEAAELAYFGAKILHPQSIIPAKENNIPVLLKNTFNPDSKGTIIKNCETSNEVRAIAAKDNIIAIKIKSYRMLMAYGFLKSIFEIFEKYQTPIDMITTSEVAVSLTIDNDIYLAEITKEIKAFGKVEVDTNMSIVCLAGGFSQYEKGISASVLNCLKNIPIRMISYGGSNYNMSLLIDTKNKAKALNLLNQGLFKETRILEEV